MSVPWSENPNNTAIHTLADGTRVDTEHLPEGQRICVHCMHLHPEGDIYTGPLSVHPVTGHWARRVQMVKVGEIEVDGVVQSVHERRGEIECVGCRVHGPHPDMEDK